MNSYDQLLDILGAELAGVADVFRALKESDWTTPTRLVPVEPDASPWSVLDLAGHLVFGANMVSSLIESAHDGQPNADRVTFFNFPRLQTAPVAYRLARGEAEGRTPADMLTMLEKTFSRVLAQASAAPSDLVGVAAPQTSMRLDEFVATRVVEAVVHGLDLTVATDRPSVATTDGIGLTAGILDDLLAQHDTDRRPDDLSDDDLRWVEAASGRRPHADNRLPLLP